MGMFCQFPTYADEQNLRLSMDSILSEHTSFINQIGIIQIRLKLRTKGSLRDKEMLLTKEIKENLDTIIRVDDLELDSYTIISKEGIYNSKIGSMGNANGSGIEHLQDLNPTFKQPNVEVRGHKNSCYLDGNNIILESQLPSLEAYNFGPTTKANLAMVESLPVKQKITVDLQTKTLKSVKMLDKAGDIVIEIQYIDMKVVESLQEDFFITPKTNQERKKRK